MSELGPSPLVSGQENHVSAARAAIHAALRPIRDSMSLPVEQALGRVLAADVVSPIDVPAHDNSAMDGYALHGAALRADAPTAAAGAAATVFAGAPYTGRSPRPVHPHHDRRGDARGAGHRGAASSCARPTASTVRIEPGVLQGRREPPQAR
jgi:hypothetical protein